MGLQWRKDKVVDKMEVEATVAHSFIYDRLPQTVSFYRFQKDVQCSYDESSKLGDICRVALKTYLISVCPRALVVRAKCYHRRMRFGIIIVSYMHYSRVRWDATIMAIYWYPNSSQQIERRTIWQESQKKLYSVYLVGKRYLDCVMWLFLHDCQAMPAAPDKPATRRTVCIKWSISLPHNSTSISVFTRKTSRHILLSICAMPDQRVNVQTIRVGATQITWLFSIHTDLPWTTTLVRRREGE